MFCKKCGSQIPDNIKFCGKCSTAVQRPAEQPGLLGLISITMEYELFGDMLRVKMSEHEFVLARK